LWRFDTIGAAAGEAKWVAIVDSNPPGRVGGLMAYILFGICSVASLLLADPPATAPATPPAQPTSRPVAAAQPRVFRCTLDGNPRTVVVELGPDLWMAFDADRCQVRKVWRGDVVLTGTVYDTKHGPQPKSRGDVLWDEPPRESLATGLFPNYKAERKRSSDPSGPGYVKQWIGHRVDSGVPTLLYRYHLYTKAPVRLAHPDAVVDVEDATEVVAGDGGATTLRRVLRLRGLPPEVRMDLVLPVPAGEAARVEASGSTRMLDRFGRSMTTTRPSTRPSDFPTVAYMDADGVHEVRLVTQHTPKEGR